MMWDENSYPDKKGSQKKLPLNLTEAEALILEVLQKNETLDIDELSALTELSINTLSKTLLNLEFEGHIVCHPGKQYRGA